MAKAKSLLLLLGLNPIFFFDSHKGLKNFWVITGHLPIKDCPLLIKTNYAFSYSLKLHLLFESASFKSTQNIYLKNKIEKETDMKIKNSTTFNSPSPTRYIISDFLEMKTRLSVCEREMLMDKIEAESIQSESLKSQPAFWMDDRVLLVLNDQPSECWFYYSRSGKMEKVRMKGSILVAS